MGQRQLGEQRSKPGWPADRSAGVVDTGGRPRRHPQRQCAPRASSTSPSELRDELRTGLQTRLQSDR